MKKIKDQTLIEALKNSEKFAENKFTKDQLKFVEKISIGIETGKITTEDIKRLRIATEKYRDSLDN